MLKVVEGMSLYALTVSRERVLSKTSKKLKKWGLPYSFVTHRFPYDLAQKGIPTYAHTVNSQEEWESLHNIGVSEIYTDWLTVSN